MRGKVIRTIEKYNMLKKGDGVVVGLSGGPDSACLLHILCSIKELYDLRIYAVHLNHMIRDEEAVRDEKYSEELSGSLKVPFYSKRIPVEEYARENRLSSEEAGRLLRYEFFNDVAQKTGSSRIALAHNMNDQAETMLMHFIRGSGISGISGIRPVREDRYIRPIISCSRDEIEEYCRVNNLNPVIDSTNKQCIYTRNRVRLEMIPYIKENFNPNIIESLYKVSDILRDEDDYINSRAFIELERIKSGDSIDAVSFNMLHIALKRRIIRVLIEEAKGNLDGIESKHISECIEFVEKGHTGKTINLPDDIECIIQYDVFKIRKREDFRDFEYELPIPGTVKIKETGVKITATLIENKNSNCADSEFIKYFDYDKIKNRLTVRNKRNGDYIFPKGMKGRKKIKDIFIDKKISREDRERTVLIAQGGEILWIPGIRDSRNCKIDENTMRIIEIRIMRGADCE